MRHRCRRWPSKLGFTKIATATADLRFVGSGLGCVKTALGKSALAVWVEVLFQVAIVAISGLTPTMFMTRVRL